MASLLSALRRRGTEGTSFPQQPQIEDSPEMSPTSSAEERKKWTAVIENPKTSPEQRFQAFKERAKIGTLEESQKDLEEAEALWRAGAVPADRLDLEKAELCKRWARISIEQGDFPRALNYYKTGSKKHEGLVLDAIDFFKKCLQRGWMSRDELPDPLAFCKEALEYHPGSLKLIFARANLFYERNSWHLAIADFAQLSQHKVTTLQSSQIPPQWIHKALAECYSQTGGVESAKMHRDLAARYERNPAVLVQRTVALLEARLESSSRIPYDIDVVLRLIDDDRTEEAWNTFQRIFQQGQVRSEDTFRALIGHARAALKLNRTNFALKTLEEAKLLAETPEEKAEVHKYVALGYAKIPNFELAHSFFKKAWKHCPDRVAIEYITFLRDRADFATALQRCHDATKSGAIPAAKSCFLEAMIWAPQQKWRHLERVCSQFFKEQDSAYRTEMLSFAIAAYRNLQHYGQAYYRMRALDRMLLPRDVVKRNEELQSLQTEAVVEAHLGQLLEDFGKNKHHHDSFQQIAYLGEFLEVYKSRFPKHIAHHVNALFLRGDLYLEKGQFEKALQDYDAISAIMEQSRDLFIDSERVLLNTRRELANNREEFRPNPRYTLLVQTVPCIPILN